MTTQNLAIEEFLQSCNEYKKYKQISDEFEIKIKQFIDHYINDVNWACVEIMTPHARTIQLIFKSDIFKLAPSSVKDQLNRYSTYYNVVKPVGWNYLFLNDTDTQLWTEFKNWIYSLKENVDYINVKNKSIE